MASKATAAAKATPSSHNIQGFSSSLITALGGTPTNAKIAFLNLWVSHEGNNSGGANGVNNPLNIFVNGKPGNFATPQAGVQATAQFLKGSYYSKVTSLLKAPNATGLQLAQAVENSPWDGGFSKTSGHYGATYNPSTGTYSGGSLSQAFSSGATALANTATGLKNGVTGATANVGTGGPVTFKDANGNTITGQTIGPSLAGQVSGAGTAALNAAEKPVTDALGNTGRDVLYGLAVLGGGMLMLTGLVLIGADIGLEKLGNNKPTQLAGRAVGGLKAQTPNARGQRREERTYSELATEQTHARARHATARSAEKVKQEKHKTAILSAKATEQRARTKSKTSSARQYKRP